MNTLVKIDELLVAARQDQRALGELLESYRGRLMRRAEKQLTRLQRRCDAGDIVQQTLAEALDGFAGFVGSSEPEFSAWINAIYKNVSGSAVRVHIQAQKRSITKEALINHALANSPRRV